ncbi:MAG: NADH-quinone oxidoreductase subunit N [Pseudomonas balearica]|uniref:NADH-quinone oxidoreductase subunit N n=1 Tax=Stutzerimonas balearica TaxID=74829 RepID=UPI0019CEBAD5|nr:NADH-quinone oxidoreductase subunit N [Stutzerimonas balearica]
MPITDLLSELCLLFGAVGIVLASAFLPQPRLGGMALLALLAIACSTGFAVAQWGEPPRLTFSGVWALDGLAVAAKLIVLGASAVVVLLSPAWFASDRRHGEFYALLLFAVLGVLMLASASDIMELVVGVLLSSVASYPLAAFHRRFAPALEAGMKYFLVGALTNTLLCIGAVWLFGLTGSTGYPAIATALTQGNDGLALQVAVGCLVVGLTFKLAAFPAHAWMPDVAQASPAPAAAFLTVVPKIGAAVALARLLALLPAELDAALLVAVLAAVTMTLGNLAALWQQDLRRLLGWSSVAQSGFALMAVAVFGRSADAASTLLAFLAAYAVANLAAFAVVIALRGRTAFTDYAGLAWRTPGAAVVLILALLSLVGIPPLVGFFGKFMLYRTVLDGGLGWLALVAALNTAISLFYYLRVAGTIVFVEPSGMPVHYLEGNTARSMVWLSGTLLIVGGILIQWLVAPLLAEGIPLLSP